MWEAALIGQFVAQVADVEEARANIGVPLKDSCDIGEESRCCDVILSAHPDPTKGRLICARYCHEMDSELLVWEEEFLLKPSPQPSISEVFRALSLEKISK
jgi:hypothetical protein